jgi:hypothetical protein
VVSARTLNRIPAHPLYRPPPHRIGAKNSALIITEQRFNPSRRYFAPSMSCRGQSVEKFPMNSPMVRAGKKKWQGIVVNFEHQATACVVTTTPIIFNDE